MSRNKLSFSLVCTACMCGFVGTAVSAPTVKKLGVSSNYLQSGGTVATPKAAVSAGNTTSARAPSLRLGTPTVKPVTINKVNTVTDTTPSVGTVDTNANRLSIGKYIHTAGVNTGYIKQASAAAEAKAQNDDIIELFERVAKLEREKQDVLTAGTGLTITDNNEISILGELEQQINNIDNSVQNIQTNPIHIYNSDTQEMTPASTVEIVDTFVLGDLELD